MNENESAESESRMEDYGIQVTATQFRQDNDEVCLLNMRQMGREVRKGR